MRILMAGALVSAILYGAMPMKIYDHYRCGYDEKRGRIVIADIRDGKPVITQKLDPEIYRDGTDDGRKAAVYYRHVDFDGHRDFVLLSGRDEYTVISLPERRFRAGRGAGKAFRVLQEIRTRYRKQADRLHIRARQLRRMELVDIQGTSVLPTAGRDAGTVQKGGD